MTDMVTLRLQPLGAIVPVKPGTALHDILFSYGVEFPCGGRGRCKGCRVRVLEGSLPVTPEQEHILAPEEIAAGWRLSCQCRVEADLTLELAQWEAAILSDDRPFTFTPRDGLGVAVDLGSTTVVAQLVNRITGHVLAVRTALNPQARFGADIMSRVGYAVAEGGHGKLVDVIRRQLGKMLSELVDAAACEAGDVREMVIVGNTVMHHLFCDINLEPLSHYPFEAPHLDGRVFSGRELGWMHFPSLTVRFLACIGSFVGSDILAGILATALHESPSPAALVDLGTNGEIVVGSRERLLCCSTAAGPAFEGARIFMGMRASTGAVSEVSIRDGKMICHILGNVSPRGICGSGLVDAVASGLDLNLILPTGRLADGGKSMSLCPPVRLSQTDIRELQLAKGAIAAGIILLLRELDLEPDGLSRIHLAGAFGNYINMNSARRIGLLEFPLDLIHPAGNTALRGAKLALFGEDGHFAELAGRIEHVSLSATPAFQETYVEHMVFPAPAPEL